MSLFSPAHRPSRRGTSAFTLIELLVVIAIIAILAAILFPVFAQAREKARAIACLSNEKQVGLAIQQYIQDNDEFLPYAINGVSATTGYITWDVALYPYTKSEGVYVCPDHKNPRPPSNGKYPVSYVTNASVMVARTSAATKDYLLAHFDAPASDIALAETNFGLTGAAPGKTNYQAFSFCNGSSPGDLAFVMDPSPTNSTNTRLAYNRHNGGANYIFLDGHAKWSLLQNTVTPTWLYGPCTSATG